MTDNIAILEGYTEQYVVEYNEDVINILAKPEDDFDDIIKVWDIDNQEFLYLKGWLFSFEIVKQPA